LRLSPRFGDSPSSIFGRVRFQVFQSYQARHRRHRARTARDRGHRRQAAALSATCLGSARIRLRPRLSLVKRDPWKLVAPSASVAETIPGSCREAGVAYSESAASPVPRAAPFPHRCIGRLCRSCPCSASYESYSDGGTRTHVSGVTGQRPTARRHNITVS
jgi:hypothetical protein